MTSKKTEIFCNWCKSDKDQNKVGEDWLGFIYHCGKCSHEYIVPGETEAGKKFYKSIPKIIEKVVKDILAKKNEN